MSLLKRFVAVWVVACACLSFAQEMQEGRLMRFPTSTRIRSRSHTVAICGWHRAMAE